MRSPLRRRCRTEFGGIAVEMLAAIMILSAISLFTLQIVRASSKATIRVQNSDFAVAYGYDVLERAKTFGCGTEVFNEARLAQRKTNCGGDTNTLGSAEFSTTDQQGNNYDAVVRTMWARSDTGGAGCAGLTGTPNILARTVTITFPLHNVQADHEIHTVEAVPPDAIEYNSQVRGSVVVSHLTPESGWAQITNPSGHQIRRYADGNGCVWFPFLPQGSRTVTLSNGSSRTVNVPGSNGRVCVRAGGGSC